MLSVLHCPEQVGSHPAILSKFERKLGVSSLSISENSNPYAVESDKNFGSMTSSMLITEILRIKLILTTSFSDGIIHLNNGRFITPFFGEGVHPKEHNFPSYIRKLFRFYAKCLLQTEIALFRLKGDRKAAFLTFQGSDARETQCFIDKYQENGLANDIIGRSGKTNKSIRSKKIKLSGIADKIYSLNPDLLTVLPKGAEFLPYATEAPLNAKVMPIKQCGEFVVGHAPTHRMVKGTDCILDVIERLKNRGYNIRLELIENLQRVDALKKFEQIDVFVDQLIIGWFGVVSLEVMALGKPVICFVKGKGLKFVPKKMLAELPILNADETSLENKIIEVYNMNVEQKTNQANKGIEFLKTWYDPQKIADKVVTDYKAVLSGRTQNCI